MSSTPSIPIVATELLPRIFAAATAVFAPLPPGSEATRITGISCPAFGNLSTNNVVSQFIAPHMRTFAIGKTLTKVTCKPIAYLHWNANSLWGFRGITLWTDLEILLGFKKKDKKCYF